jgi:hypothetical protein
VARLRSGTLAAWSCAWLNGTAAADDVIEATVGDDAPHVVEDLPGAASVAPLSELLIALRRAPRAVRLVLPVPGDVRGVPGPAEFRAAALEAAEAVVIGRVGLVPEVVEYFPSSAPTSVTWHAYAVEAMHADYQSVADAGQDLAIAIRDCTSALLAAGVAGSSTDIGEALQTARRAGERLRLPPGFPQRAVALLARAEQLHEVLGLATADPLGGAVDRFSASARESSLRPLAAAVRRARLAGYNALADAMVG